MENTSASASPTKVPRNKGNRPATEDLATGPFRNHPTYVDSWIKEIGLDPAVYGTYSMRRTKTSLVCRRTKSTRAVQLLLGHTKLESTVRYLGIEVEDVLEMSEQTEV